MKHVSCAAVLLCAFFLSACTPITDTSANPSNVRPTVSQNTEPVTDKTPKSAAPENAAPESAPEIQAVQNETAENRMLIAYFSYSGTTKEAAQRIASLSGGTLFEIVPKVPYTDADVDYHDKNSRTTKEKEDPAFRPEIAAAPADLEQYSTVMIGFPVWWYKAPNIVYTFMDQSRLKGKTVSLFCTSGGSSISGSQDQLKKAYPNDIDWKDGLRITHSTSDDDIKTWISTLK